MKEQSESIKKMVSILKEMVSLVYQGFMENDGHYLNSALNKERIVDDLEREVTLSIIKMSKETNEKEKKELILLGQVAENLERMGDEVRYLMERIEIKIAEGLFFSDIGVEQYKEVFFKMQKSVNLTFEFLNNNKEEDRKSILENGLEIKDLIERYRVEHMDRLTKGICQPMAANMFFDMLDFTGNIARHCTNIARIYKNK
jgi:phosphate:Na+ symporter